MVQKFLAGEGVIHEGVIHEKILFRIYAQSAAPWSHKRKNRILKKISSCICSQKGVIHEGVMHEGVIHEALQYLLEIQVEKHCKACHVLLGVRKL